MMFANPAPCTPTTTAALLKNSMIAVNPSRIKSPNTNHFTS